MKQKLSFGDLIKSLSQQLCQNPKDWRYGLLGITDSLATMIVDYNLTNEDGLLQALDLLVEESRRIKAPWMLNAKRLMRALNVSYKSCLTFSRSKDWPGMPSNSFAQRYKLRLDMGTRMVLECHRTPKRTTCYHERFLAARISQVSRRHYTGPLPENLVVGLEERLDYYSRDWHDFSTGRELDFPLEYSVENPL